MRWAAPGACSTQMPVCARSVWISWASLLLTCSEMACLQPTTKPGLPNLPRQKVMLFWSALAMSLHRILPPEFKHKHAFGSWCLPSLPSQKGCFAALQLFKSPQQLASVSIVIPWLHMLCLACHAYATLTVCTTSQRSKRSLSIIGICTQECCDAQNRLVPQNKTSSAST